MVYVRGRKQAQHKNKGTQPWVSGSYDPHNNETRTEITHSGDKIYFLLIYNSLPQVERLLVSLSHAALFNQMS